MASASYRPAWLSWVYTHNPFYAISVVLMLFGVRAGYGRLEIGSIDSWIMVGVLAGYTVMLAGIAVAIVRWGKVWDDARSLFVLLLLLFLAVSISADELFVTSSSPMAGIALLAGGFLGSSLLSELVLRGARIRLGCGIRGPYHLMLALFYVAPWWCSPELHRRSPEALEWAIFLFPTTAAGLCLLLLPAVRRGQSYTENSGTPWPWPWFPWTMFGVIAGAVALRSFVLSMTFGPTGPIWKGPSRTLQNINFDTIFGPYFLVPLAYVLMWLVLEGALVAGHRRTQQRLLACAPLLLLMAIPFGGNDVFRGFLDRFVERCGSPVWITTWLLLVFYLRAWLSRVPFAGAAGSAALLLLAVVGPGTVGFETLTAPQLWPIVTVGGLAAFQGVYRRSPFYSVVGGGLLTLGLSLSLPQSMPTGPRLLICGHVLWGAAVVIGLSFHDRLARILRILGALPMPAAALVALATPQAETVMLPWRILYVATLAGVAMAIAGLFRQRWYLYAFAGTIAVAVYSGSMVGYRQAVSTFGRPAMAAITWSVGTLVIALLISARKAKWLPTRLNGR